jgi:multidrug efflux pump subunit AcrB
VSLLDRAFDRCSAGRDSHGRILYPASDLRLGYRGHHGAGGFDLLLPAARFAISRHHAPQVVVSAVYPGASAQVVADTVTTPLEQQINGVTGMTYMSSSSSNDGSSTITVTFDIGYPLSIAAVDVQNRVAQAASSLPPIVNQAGVTIRKQNPNFVLIVNLTSPDGSVDPVALSNYAYLQIVDPLKRLAGVGDVQIFGERRYSMRVWLDPDKLANLGITAVDVQNAIAEQNVQVAAGKIGQSPALLARHSRCR